MKIPLSFSAFSAPSSAEGAADESLQSPPQPPQAPLLPQSPPQTAQAPRLRSPPSPRSLFPPSPSAFPGTDTVPPLSECAETPEAFELRIEVPGVPPDALEITVQNGSLRVEGRRRQEERGAVLVRELPTGHFAREFHLSSTIDPQRISASLNQGLLRLHLPKTPAALPRRIPLQIPPP